MPISTVGKVVTGNTPPTNRPEYYGGTVPFVAPGDLGGGKFIFSSEKTITTEALKVSRPIPAGATLFTCIGSTIGKIGIAATRLTTNQQINAVIPSADHDPEYVYYQLAYNAERIAILAGSQAVPIISKGQFSAESILIAPREEERRIAEILATWDRAIETVEALIANARAEKKALMQSLLTGKKRLPGFSGEWAASTLEKAASILVSNVDKKSDASEKSVRLCNYMDVYRLDRIEADGVFMAATATDAQIRKFGLSVGDFLITKDSETPDDIAVPSLVVSSAPDFVCGYHLAIIRPKKGVDGQFLKYFFEHPHTRQFFASRANGATRFGLTAGAIETAPIALPGYDEQRRIGEIINASELEIERLGLIGAALRQEKSALMQQLLTGKRRVTI